MNRIPLILLAAVLAGLLLAGWYPGAIGWLRPAPPPVAVPHAIAPRGDLTLGEQTVIALFQAARPSVVAITTATEAFNPYTRRRQEVPRGLGSGFVWDAEGHIVTNNHVIAGASRAQVQLADGRVLAAELVGTDPSHDLAVLRIDAGNAPPPPLPIGTSSDLQVGQSVLAIGNPFGLDWTLTTGIVSALEREIPGEGGPTMGGLIQTDAAINPGNSGGPLIDSAGRLIGINAAIFSRSGSNAGIGFAVPVDMVNRVVPQLIASGRYVAPVLGIQDDERINALARAQGIAGDLVLGVEPGSPAAKAGLRPATATRTGIVPGDIVVGFGGAEIATADDLLRALDRHAPGDTVDLEVLREGERITLRVTLAAG